MPILLNDVVGACSQNQETAMRGKARLLCALMLVLLCVAARLQDAWCLGGGGHGGGGEGGGGHGGGGEVGDGHGEGGGAGGGGFGRGDGDEGGVGWRGGSGFTPWWHGRSAATEPRSRGVSMVSGAAAAFAAAALVLWL